MIDKQKIRAEIVRRIGNILQVGNEAYLKCHLLDLYYAKRSYESLLSFIDSMPQEPVCEDLNKEFNRFIVNEEGVPRFLSYEKQIEWGLDIARHFAEWQREQLMKELWHKGKDNPGNKHPYPVINPDTQEMAFAYYDQRFGLWEFDRDYHPGRNMLWLDIEKIIPNLQEGGAQ